ncbi:TrpR, YerC/YecD [Candidatus Gracilibacteria bacterium]|nr:TrpR, YerC/YecD [Candidatus Gracilibacteria bacterium]
MEEKNLNTKEMKLLFEAMTTLKTPAEAKKFLRDLCTLAELEDMAERLNVAKLVDKKVPYREIAEKTGSSTATITRVAHWLNHGMGGYKMMISRTARTLNTQKK